MDFGIRPITTVVVVFRLEKPDALNTTQERQGTGLLEHVLDNLGSTSEVNDQLVDLWKLLFIVPLNQAEELFRNILLFQDPPAFAQRKTSDLCGN